MTVEIRILQSKDFPGCQAAEKSQLNLQVMVGIGSGSQECAKLFRGIENRISGRLRIVPDLLEVSCLHGRVSKRCVAAYMHNSLHCSSKPDRIPEPY